MSDNKNINEKFTGKKLSILAVAAITVTMIGSSVPVAIQPVQASQEKSTAISVLPDNITIDQSAELADIELPSSEYGTLEWADGSYVPTQRVQACEVILVPAEGQDLSNAEGWDPETGVVVGTINVIVNGLDDSSEDESEAEVTAVPEKDQDDQDENTASEDDSTDDDKNSSDETGANSKAENDSDNKKDAEKQEKTEKQETEGSEVIGELKPAGDNTEQETENRQDSADSEENSADREEDNIFDNPEMSDDTDGRSDEADDNVSEAEKEKLAESNHTCNGITVSGINLPWYVQFRVSSGDSYQFTNESDAMIFKSYEFELWDLQNDTEYEIPSGEYISVTVPVKAGYQYTIEHLLDNGATETIIPSVDDDVMVFSTHSFSPFGIAGSRQLVGPDSGDDTDDAETVTPVPTDTSAQTQSSDSEDSSAASPDAVSDNNGNSSVSQTSDSEAGKTAENSNAVNTGDTTMILPFVVLIAAAAVIIGGIVFIKRKKK